MEYKSLMPVTTGRQSAAARERVAGAAAVHMPESVRLDSLDDLLRAARELLQDSRLDVGVVTPLICSLLDTFVDRYRVYPYDEVGLLLARLEQDGYPAQALRDLISRIEQAYEQYHGEGLSYPQRQAALADEFEDLRQSLKYAAMVAEQEHQK